MVSISYFQLISLLFFGVFLLGGLNLYFSDQKDYCLMTYMFEYPQFVKISVPHSEDFPQYGLYSYSEGRLTEKARKMRFDGVPVLFLPGNAGSHMQVRSLASVALRKGLSYDFDYHFDFFTVDFNEELSGWYGGLLEQQTRFAALSAWHVLNLYKNNKYMQSIPTSVIVIGHSIGGVIAKRLLVYQDTGNITHIAITLAAPLEAPVVNSDLAMEEYYRNIDKEWNSNVSFDAAVKEKKVLLSFGSGVRDITVPSGLCSSEHSDLSALTTAVPGVWVSTDHRSIVWCKQLVMVINKFLFSIVDVATNQVIEEKASIMTKARQYFKANRSMTLSPVLPRFNVTMLPDAFWYEDNRRVYQIARPEIDKMTYLMIRLVSFPQNRFVAIEAINLDDSDWVFGCNAEFIHGSHRFCKTATSLGELSRWTGAGKLFGKRKLATIHLHDLTLMYPKWTHVIVKVSPTRKPIELNVDVNDNASRHLTVDVPSIFALEPTIIKQETEQNALYYELSLAGMSLLHHAYFLHVEPTPTCKASEYHVSAEMHIPWAESFEYYHYFTHLKKSPMKLRLNKNNPNVTKSLPLEDKVKITLLLDPQCTFSISISPSRYHLVAQMVRNYSPTLVVYVAAILVLATRCNLISMYKSRSWLSVNGALISDGLKPYHVLVSARMGSMAVASVPVLAYVLETVSSKNMELQYFTRSLLSIPGYMAALGLVHILATAVLVAMVFSSQLWHRLLLRVVWCGGSGGLAERLAGGLQRVPTVVSAALVCSAHASCGAAALAAGAAFYAFIVSKMYEEYLEDYGYRLLAKIVTKLRGYFKLEKRTQQASNSETQALIKKEDSDEVAETENQPNEIETKVKTVGCGDNVASVEVKEIGVPDDNKPKDDTLAGLKDNKEKLNEPIIKELDQKAEIEDNVANTRSEKAKKQNDPDTDVDEQLNGLNFHMMMFFLWLTVAAINTPVLLSWAKKFKYNMVLKPDTSYYPGLVMSVCAGFVWQMEGPRKNLKYYHLLSQMLFVLAVSLLVLAPFAFHYINYIVTAVFLLITLQQLFDTEIPQEGAKITPNTSEPSVNSAPECEEREGDNSKPSTSSSNTEGPPRSNKVEDKIFDSFKDLKEKADLLGSDVL